VRHGSWLAAPRNPAKADSAANSQSFQMVNITHIHKLEASGFAGAALCGKVIRERLGRTPVRKTEELLRTWLTRQLGEARRAWLVDRLDHLSDGASERELYIALGLVPRRLGKADLALQPADLQQAREVRPGWDPSGLSVDQAARILMLLAEGTTGQAFASRFRQLCRTADLGEQIAFYRGLPLYPDPELLENQAAEGTRTNIKAVFEAVAHRNPYPKEQFSENRWNHMVLKALFVGSELHPIQGLDERANAELATMLHDYAHERWAASRSVSPELWRCIGPFASGAMVDDLARVLDRGNETEQKAAMLALAASPDPTAKDVLARHPAASTAAGTDELSWDRLAAEA
jgi:hypothetical protein